MKTVGAFEAKTHLSRLLEDVQKGEKVIVTKHGEPIAEIIPIRKLKHREPNEVADRIKQMRSNLKARQGSTDTLTVREMIEEGRE